MVAAVGRTRPPRVAVVARVGRARRVHVGTDRGHVVRVEPAAEVQEPGFREEVGEIGVVVFGPERAVQIERRAGAVVEVDRTSCVHRARVDERAQHDPPVEEVAEVAAQHVEPSAGEERHRRLEIVDDVGDVGVAQPDRRDTVGAGLGS